MHAGAVGCRRAKCKTAGGEIAGGYIVWYTGAERKGEMQMFFSKPEYREIMMPFRFDDSQEDFECGGISIEAFGDVFGEQKYCYASYILKDKNLYDNGEYEQMRKLLEDAGGKEIKVVFKLKKGKAKDFKVDLDSLASALGDDRFQALELVGWGMNDKGIS